MNDDDLERARELAEHRSWRAARDALAAIDVERPLEAEDLERLAVAAYMAGDDDSSVDALTRAVHAWIDRGGIGKSIRCSFWVGVILLLHGQMAPAHGWFMRAHRMLTDVDTAPFEAAYVDLGFGIEALFSGDPGAALRRLTMAAEAGDGSGDADLATLGRLGTGQALIGTGRAREGVAELDAAMVAVTAGEVSPVVAGIVYCAVIEECRELFDIRRAQEWTVALSHWCDAQPGLVPYRGQCLVHRVELLRLHGAWDGAAAEAERAVDLLSSPAHPAAGAAHYELAELHRRRGEFDEAERAYRIATDWGHSAQPGLALLWLDQGRSSAAVAALERSLDEPQLPAARIRLLAARVETLLAVGDVSVARVVADELTAAAREFVTAPALEALTNDVSGAVLLAEGDPKAALRCLRAAWTAWHELDAPYEAARGRALIGMACRALGDDDTADLELAAARRVFARLGANADVTRLDRVLGALPSCGLTAREVEVLGLVATGRTNREIAAELVISDKTVARHLSNIFVKLGISSRTAATAYAYEHQLV